MTIILSSAALDWKVLFGVCEPQIPGWPTVEKYVDEGSQSPGPT